MTKKDYYKKSHRDCACCGWQGHPDANLRKWLSRHERSKQEDFSYLGHDLTGIPTTEESWCVKCGTESHIIEKLKIRCSEHDGNIVREVQ